jgi:hypothetical protein
MKARQTRKARRTGRKSVFGFVALAALVATTAALTQAARPPADEGDVAGVRDLLQKWVDTRRQISKEKQEWALGRELVQSRLELVEGEIGVVRAKIADVESGITDLERKRAEAEAKKAALQGTSDELAATVVALEHRTLALLEQLPEPLREKLRPISQSLPTDPDTADKGKLGERYLSVVGVLNEVNKFNREIRAESEIRALPNGASVEVTTVYIGIAQAYYASANGSAAGYGVPKAKGWEWIPADEHAAEITRAIAILSKGADADFVNLPIRVQ